jgi:hypothetical protein
MKWLVLELLLASGCPGRSMVCVDRGQFDEAMASAKACIATLNRCLDYIESVPGGAR